MRTNIVLDDALMRQAFRCSGIKTKKQLLAAALKEFVANHSRMDLRELRGGVRFRKGYDHKALREGA